jgi:hypothetical protein
MVGGERAPGLVGLAWAVDVQAVTDSPDIGLIVVEAEPTGSSGTTTTLHIRVRGEMLNVVKILDLGWAIPMFRMM